jgi:hypothetical protein
MITLSRRRKVIYALVAMGIAATLCVAVLLALDIYVHWRTQDVAGVNVWGYRGARVGNKQPGEVRVVMLGGSTTYGWDLYANESIPAFLERRLNQRGRRFSVVNLGAPGQGAYGFVYDLADYEYLDFDIVALYEGYNDLPVVTPRGFENFLLWRRSSPIFRWTGYLPLLPLALREKADLMVGGSSNDGRTRFQFGTRAAAGAMRAVAAATQNLTSVRSGLTPVPPDAPAEAGCDDTFRVYCGSVREAIAWSVARRKPVIVASQPYISDLHKQQQANLAAMIKLRFGNEPRVWYVNLGDAIDMTDREVAYDGIHLIARGNDAIAARLVDPVLKAAQ